MMQTGALIVAAGKSSRMGDFKPMLQLGSISIAQRVINNFRQAGISKIVVVTGYNADALERHLASNHVIFFEMRTMKLLICLILSGLDWNI